MYFPLIYKQAKKCQVLDGAREENYQIRKVHRQVVVFLPFREKRISIHPVLVLTCYYLML